MVLSRFAVIQLFTTSNTLLISLNDNFSIVYRILDFVSNKRHIHLSNTIWFIYLMSAHVIQCIITKNKWMYQKRYYVSGKSNNFLLRWKVQTVPEMSKYCFHIADFKFIEETFFVSWIMYDRNGRQRIKITEFWIIVRVRNVKSMTSSSIVNIHLHIHQLLTFRLMKYHLHLRSLRLY